MLCAPKLSLPWYRWECFQSKRRTHPIVHSCTPTSLDGSLPLWSSHLHLNSETHFLYHITNFVGFLNYCFLISFGYRTFSPEGRYFFFTLVPLEAVFFNFLYPVHLKAFFFNNIFLHQYLWITFFMIFFIHQYLWRLYFWFFLCQYLWWLLLILFFCLRQVFFFNPCTFRECYNSFFMSVPLEARSMMLQSLVIPARAGMWTLLVGLIDEPRWPPPPVQKKNPHCENTYSS